MDANDHLRGAALLSPGPDSPQGATPGRGTEEVDTSQRGSLILDAAQGDIMMPPKQSEDSLDPAATTSPSLLCEENADLIGVDRTEAAGDMPSDKDDEADEVGSKNEQHTVVDPGSKTCLDHSHLVTNITQHPHAECVKLMHYAMDAKRAVGDQVFKNHA